MKIGVQIEVDEWCTTVCRMIWSKVKVTSNWKPLKRSRLSVPHGAKFCQITLTACYYWHCWLRGNGAWPIKYLCLLSNVIMFGTGERTERYQETVSRSSFSILLRVGGWVGQGAWLHNKQLPTSVLTGLEVDVRSRSNCHREDEREHHQSCNHTVTRDYLCVVSRDPCGRTNVFPWPPLDNSKNSNRFTALCPGVLGWTRTRDAWYTGIRKISRY